MTSDVIGNEKCQIKAASYFEIRRSVDER